MGEVRDLVYVMLQYNGILIHIGPTQRSDREIMWSVVRVTKSCTTGKWVPYNEGIVTCVSL